MKKAFGYISQAEEPVVSESLVSTLVTCTGFD